jgi:hypothetical protein
VFKEQGGTKDPRDPTIAHNHPPRQQPQLQAVEDVYRACLPRPRGRITGPRKRRWNSSTSGRRRACPRRCGRHAGPEPRRRGAQAAPCPTPAQNSSSSASISSCVRACRSSRRARRSLARFRVARHSASKFFFSSSSRDSYSSGKGSARAFQRYPAPPPAPTGRVM